MSQQKPSMLNEEDLINFDVYFPPFKYWSKNNLPDPEIINDLTSKEKIDTGNIYIHFPFCPVHCKICPYFKFPNELLPDVANLMLKEIELYAKLTKKNTKIRSILIGGGTPNFIPLKIFEKMIVSLKKNFKLDDLQQFAIELRPEIKYEKHVEILLKYFDPKILHVSLGLQSSHQEKIKFWRKPVERNGLYYSKEDVENMIYFLHKNKIKDINVDFMVENANAFFEERKYIKHLIETFKINKISIYTVYSRFMGREYLKNASDWNFKEIIKLRKEEQKFFKIFNFVPLIWPMYFVKKGYKVNMESLTQFEGVTLFAIGPSARGVIRSNNIFLMYENTKNYKEYKDKILKNKLPNSILYKYHKM